MYVVISSRGIGVLEAVGPFDSSELADAWAKKQGYTTWYTRTLVKPY